MRYLLKIACLVIVMAVLFFNLVLDFFKPDLCKPAPLYGFFTTAPKDTLTLRRWFSGDYPEKTGEYVRDNYFFRNFFIRLNNQLRYSLFKTCTNWDVVIGKNNYLYQFGYWRAFHGDDFTSVQEVETKTRNLKLLNDRLTAMGKRLLVVLAPNKVRIYPENLPEHLSRQTSVNGFYVNYVRQLLKHDISFIDFNNWYYQRKDTCTVPLFSQMGVHWSRMEAVLALDTITRRLSRMSGKKIPMIKITRTYLSDSLEEPDGDALRSLNLFWSPRFVKMRYPEFLIENPGDATNNLLTVSDSYWWDIYNRDLPAKLFKRHEFWYYNKDAYSRTYGSIGVDKLDLHRRILQNDLIVIVCTESNLHQFGYGFVEAALDALNSEIVPTEEELRDYSERISHDEGWTESIRQKANKFGMPADSLLKLDAAWMVKNRGPLNYGLGEAVVIERIVTNPGWLAQIQKQADTLKISLDSCIKMNARYIVSEYKKE